MYVSNTFAFLCINVFFNIENFFRILEAARCSHLTDAGFTLLARVRAISES